MMENRYDRYKDSGVAWIGEIPEHWEIIKIKYILKNNSLKVGPFGSQLSGSDILSKGKYWIYNQRTVLDNNYSSCNSFISNEKYNDLIGFKVSAGDILLTTRGTIGKISRIPSIFNEGVIHPCIIRFNINEKILKYEILRYIFNDSDIVTNQVKYNSNSTTIDVIYSDTLKNIVLAYIPQKEQQSIAAYLDQKCGEIDELITLQEEMITKLQSYKQSVITEAVTKGLDKNVPLKDSGIEWIGKIPEHWEVRRMKSIYNFGKGLSITKADLVDKGIPVISYGQIHSKLNIGTCIKDSLIRYVPKVFLENNNTSLVKKGDVIFADTSEDLEGCGNCIYIDRDMLLYAGYHTIIAKSISTSYNRYFSYLFQTDCWRFQIRRMVNGVKLFSIPQKLLASADLIVPSTQEQQSIADYLDQRCSEIDELISIKQQKIEKLKEYKKSLIFECVTGKRKVS